MESSGLFCCVGKWFWHFEVFTVKVKQLEDGFLGVFDPEVLGTKILSDTEACLYNSTL